MYDTSDNWIPVELLPDRLFRTRSGKLPHVLWGVPFSREIFPHWKKPREKRSRETIETLFQMALGKVPKNQRWLRKSMILQTFQEGMEDDSFPWGPFAVLAIVRVCPILDAKIQPLIVITAESILEEARRLSLAEEPLKYLLWRGELALTLAYLLPQAAETAERYALGMAVVQEVLAMGLEEDGLLKAEILPISRILLASLLRIRWMFPDLFASDEEKKKMDAWIRNTLFFTRPDGSMVFTSPETGTACWNPELFVAALQCDTSRMDKKLGISILPGFQTQKPIPPQQLPADSFSSEESKWAILRQKWNGAACFVHWRKNHTPMELLLPQTPLLSGPWEYLIRCNGYPLSPVGEWNVVCWHDTPLATYLELERTLLGGFKIQRQFCLARRDEIAFWGDSIFHPNGFEKEVPLEYCASIPLFPGVSWMENGESMEVKVAHPSGGKGTFLPLALPEWRSELTVGNDFTVKDGKLQWRVTSPKKSLYAPLLLDFSTRRTHNELTWRRLTVAEKLKDVAPSIASGFRIQIGETQWLLYHSLTQPTHRTVLGHNLQSESMLGRFTSRGEVQPLVEILGYQEENK